MTCENTVQTGILPIRETMKTEAGAIVVERVLNVGPKKHGLLPSKKAVSLILSTAVVAITMNMFWSNEASAQAPICPPPPFASKVDNEVVYFVPIGDSAVAVDAQTSQNISEANYSSTIRQKVDKLKREIVECRKPKPVISSPQEKLPTWPNMPLENHVGAALFVGVIAAFWGLISGHIAFPRRVPCKHDESDENEEHVTGEWSENADREHAIAMHIIKNRILGGGIKGMIAYAIATAGTIFAENSSLIDSIKNTFFPK